MDPDGTVTFRRLMPDGKSNVKKGPKKTCQSPVIRLDYKDTPFKARADVGGDMYVMRFKSDYCPTNSDYPVVGRDGWAQPPCTGTGYLASEERLIPEYTYGTGQRITDGAIFRIDANGNESLIAYWSHNRFNEAKSEGE